ncbi:MAG TPA: ABC transporter ATP-binding protein, partial [Thermoanaerobaculia bacterium]|nr:ABC transporter ATP-binding protein [Thermoanaerobaculia bacterium]
MSVLSADRLTRDFGARRALDGVSLAVDAGEVFALLGPNGAGKTTLFRILATLLAPTSGTFRVAGHEPSGDLAALRRALGVVFQSPSLDRKLTVLENLLLQGTLYGLAGAPLRSRAGELLDRFGIADRAGDAVETLSGGLARRVEIAKALLHRPPVLLLDEPSTGLDPGARRDLTALLASLAAAGAAVLLTTHLVEEAEAATRVGILDRGRLAALGTPAALRATVGGDVLALETEEGHEAEALARAVAARSGAAAGQVTAVGATVRLERARGPQSGPAPR